MRTTLELPDPLFREVKIRAIQQGVTLKDLLARYIQAGMAAPATAAVPLPRVHIPLPIFRPVDGSIIPARSNADLFAMLEEEDAINHDRVMANPNPKP